MTVAFTLILVPGPTAELDVVDGGLLLQRHGIGRDEGDDDR